MSRFLRVPPPLQDTGRDVRFAVRLFRRDLGFTIAAVMTLALGIGASGTIFTIFDGMFLKGLPVDRPDRIVRVGAMDRHGRPVQLSLPEFDDWSAAATSFRGLAAYKAANVVLDDDGQPRERVSASYISSSAFALLGEPPIIGRVFTAADDERGAPRTLVIGEGIWRERYGADPRIVGRSLRVNGEPATVIGVMPARFRFPMIDKAWLPLGLARLSDDKRDARTLAVVGRLADRVTISQARAELDTIADRLARAYPDTDNGLRAGVAEYVGGFSGFDNPWSDSLLAATLLLLIGCANVASLLLARGAARARDLAIRSALGASRWRLLRQLLVESTLLSAAAASVGLGLTWAGMRVWTTSLPAANWPYWFRWDIDARVLTFLTIAGAGTAVVAGLAPALHASRSGAGAMKDDVRSGVTSRGTRRWTTSLIAAEVALTLVLLAAAGLMVRTTIKLLQIDSLVDTSSVLTASVQLPEARYGTPEQRTRFVESFVERLEAQPTIRFATVANATPFYNAPLRALTVAGRAEQAGGPPRAVSYVTIGADYFEALGVHLTLGRRFSAIDGTTGHFSAIVNQRFVQMFFGGHSPLGRAIRVVDPNAGGEAPWLTIVGVSPSIPQHYARDLDPVVYVPFREDPTAVPTIFVRTTADANRAAPVVRQTLRELDANLVLFGETTIEQLLTVTGFANHVFLTFFSAFALFALLLSAIGVYATTSHAVIQRRHEVGVRMALGAQARQVVWLFARRTLSILAFGGLAGLAGALAVARLMKGFLVDTSPFDPGTLVSMALLLAAVAAVATLVPARRAAQLDPTVALRCD